jgi:hypothetical protein
MTSPSFSDFSRGLPDARASNWRFDSNLFNYAHAARAQKAAKYLTYCQEPAQLRRSPPIARQHLRLKSPLSVAPRDNHGQGFKQTSGASCNVSNTVAAEKRRVPT